MPSSNVPEMLSLETEDENMLDIKLLKDYVKQLDWEPRKSACALDQR